MRRAQHFLSLLLIVAVAGLALWAVNRYSFETDWTYANRNSLTEASRRVLGAMPGEIAFTAYAYPGPVRQTIRSQVERYQRYDEDITLTFVDPATNPQLMRELDVARSGEVRVAYQGRDLVLPGLTEQQITSALQRLSVAGEHWVVFLTGHDERDPTDTTPGGYSTLRDMLERQGLQVRGLNLAEVPAIPDNTAVLVVASPQTEFLPGAAGIIRDYVAGGGNLLWLDDPSNGYGLDAVAAALGINWRKGTVIYPDYRKLGTGHPAIALVVNYPPHPITENLAGLTVYPFAGGVQAREDADWIATGIIKTPPRSWLETGDVDAAEIRYQESDGDVLGPITIGIALSRPYPEDDPEDGLENGRKVEDSDSAAPDPEAGNETAAAQATQENGQRAGAADAQADASTKPVQQRAVVVADSDFLTNANIATLSNAALGAGLFQWLAYRDRQIAVHVPPAPGASLHLAPWQGRSIWWLFVVGLPLALVALGVGRWWLRRRR